MLQLPRHRTLTQQQIDRLNRIQSTLEILKLAQEKKEEKFRSQFRHIHKSRLNNHLPKTRRPDRLIHSNEPTKRNTL